MNKKKNSSQGPGQSIKLGKLQLFAIHPSWKSCSISSVGTQQPLRAPTHGNGCRSERVSPQLLPWLCSARRSAAGRTGRPVPCQSACWPEWGRGGPTPAAAPCRQSPGRTRGWCCGRRWTGARSAPPRCATACSCAEPWKQVRTIYLFLFIHICPFIQILRTNKTQYWKFKH